MYYHSFLEILPKRHYFWNSSLDQIMTRLVIPYLNRQIIAVNAGKGRAILNLSAASYLQVYKTEEHLRSFDDFQKQLQAGKLDGSDCTQEIIDTAMIGRTLATTKSTLQNQFAITAKQVFVIMQFDDSTLNSAYEGAIKPIVKKHKYKPIRIDELQDSGKITDQIIEEISKSEIIIADLSGERPNCYYEAGFAHAIGKEMIFAVRKNTPIHFDLSAYRFIEWDTEQELRERLDSRFKSIKKRGASL